MLVTLDSANASKKLALLVSSDSLLNFSFIGRREPGWGGGGETHNIKIR